MDVSPESLFNIMNDLQIPITTQELQNPTNAFMKYIMTEILMRLSIDVDVIRRPTFEQIDALRLTGVENASIVSLINCRQAISTISREIFIKDFTITDITNPGPKRTRKILKIMANFLLYTRGAIEQMQQKVHEVLARGQRISETHQKNQQLTENMNIKAAGIAKKKATVEALNREIEEITTKIGIGKESMAEIEAIASTVKKNHQRILVQTENKHEDVKELTQINEKLKEKVVKDPELYQTRLMTLEVDFKNKEEKRTVLQDALKSKKPTIAMLVNCLTMSVQAHNKLIESIEISKEILKVKEELETLEQQINEIVSTLQTDIGFTMENNGETTADEVNKCKAVCEEHLIKYRSTINELLNEKKLVKKMCVDKQSEEMKMYSKRDLISLKIIEKEAEIDKFLTRSRDLMNTEIKEIFVRHREAYDAVNATKFSRENDSNKF